MAIDCGEQQMLTNEEAADMKDAARYRWLRDRLLGADFDWNDSGECVLVFQWPRNVPVGADCDRNIDAAMAVAAPGGEEHQ